MKINTKLIIPSYPTLINSLSIIVKSLTGPSWILKD